MFKKKKKRILIMLANSLKKSSNNNSTSARFLASLRRMNKAMVGLGWVASIATHNKKMTIWMITKVHLIGQTRLPSSFSNTGGVTLGTETKNTVRINSLIGIVIDNLAALDCYATIEGTSKYQKTYQDKMDVKCLFGDPFQAQKAFNIDKMFDDTPD
jgi:hypothetical protein